MDGERGNKGRDTGGGAVSLALLFCQRLPAASVPPQAGRTGGHQVEFSPPRTQALPSRQSPCGGAFEFKYQVIQLNEFSLPQCERLSLVLQTSKEVISGKEEM